MDGTYIKEKWRYFKRKCGKKGEDEDDDAEREGGANNEDEQTWSTSAKAAIAIASTPKHDSPLRHIL